MGARITAHFVVALLCGAQSDVDPVPASLCIIAKDPAAFDGKMVRLRAKVHTGFEASILTDPACGADVWLSLGDELRESSTESAMIDSFADIKYPESLKWKPIQPKIRVSFQEDTGGKKLIYYLGKQFKSRKHLCLGCPLYSVTATFVGRLDHSPHRLVAYRDKNGKVRGGSGGFGHLNGWESRMVVKSVEDVVAEKINPAIYLVPKRVKR